jgi:hypothetical protein
VENSVSRRYEAAKPPPVIGKNGSDCSIRCTSRAWHLRRNSQLDLYVNSVIRPMFKHSMAKL